ncbi:MAG: hypothetical protein K2N10_04845, partial [Muribaculaceae bacterium]|nr:hypothetical protein [Muribaculaceae bacterium]
MALWNKTYDMDNRLKTVEDLCKELNSNVSALHTIVTALQSNDYIRSISPVTDFTGNVIGYNIVFDKSGTVTIYHGKDGKDGVNGKDGLNGADGKDGKAGLKGADGKEGNDGRDGQEGKDGIDCV